MAELISSCISFAQVPKQEKQYSSDPSFGFVKDNLASDFWISDLWFLGQTAMQMNFAK